MKQLELTLEKVIVRLMMAWLMTAILFYLKTEMNFNGASYAFSINLIMFVIFVLIFTVFFTILAYFRLFVWFEAYGPLILLTIYGFMTVNANQDLIYLVGFLVMITIAAVYAVQKVQVFVDVKTNYTVWIGYVIVAAIFCGITGLVTVYRYLNFYNSTYDMGIWTQMFYYMKTTLEPLTTCERDYLLSHYAVHFSPIYYVYLPFFYVFPSAITLQVLQVVTLASGFIPVYLLCKHFKLSKSATLVFGILFGLFPSLATGCYYDMHENCFLTPFLLWLFYFIEKNNKKGVIIFTLLTILVKEDAPVYLASIGLFVIVYKKKYIMGGILTGVSVAAFVLVTMLIGAFGLGVQAYRYSNFMTADSTGGLMDVIRNLVINPAYFIGQCFTTEKLEFLAYMFLPLGFLPFMTKKISKYILFIPLVLVNLASVNQYQHSIFFQYTFGILAILFYLAISNYAEMEGSTRRIFALVAVAATLLLMPMGSMSKLYYVKLYSQEKENIEALNEAMDEIPKDASVVASTFFLPHLAQRDEVYMYPSQNEGEYVILDLRNAEDVTEADILELKQDGYTIEKQVDGLYVILRK